MGEELHLISDLALILISAGIITIIFKLLKQPLVLGYIVAGFLVGPHFNVFPTVIETQSIEVWSEIGIIFLLFVLGLEFSFKKLFSVGSTAFITAGTEILLMFVIGFFSGYLLDWTPMESIFLGGMLAMSSTTIIIKAFDDLGLKKEKFADITMVVLIIQDIVAIVMMVLLSTAAVSQKFSGLEMLNCILKLIFFLILWFVVGISVIPTFFRKAKKYINDETLLIISIGLCFGMVVFANYVGFSSALGAFVMGSILCETTEGRNIEKLSKGIKDLFGAIFFVSVGMMVDPHIIVEYWGTILVITLITLVVKAFVSSFGVLISGESLKTSVQTGFSLAQIGEFAFIIASLGVSLKVLNPFIYPVIVAVSVITTFTTPYCIRFAVPFYNWLDRRLSPTTKAKLDRYKLVSSSSIVSDEWKIIITKTMTRTLVFLVMCIATILVSFRYFYPFVYDKLSETIPISVCNVLNAVVTLLVLSPFLYGLMTNKHATQELYSQLWRKNRFNRIIIVAWTLLRIFIACVFVTLVLSKSFKFTRFVIIIIAIFIAFFILFSQKSLKRYIAFEDNFLANLSANEEDGQEEDHDDMK
ncbi:MAG: cation:proton antiporter [Bacteroidales bacterium]|nr:cation:proton antiporter [Bacteroidales bacterium]